MGSLKPLSSRFDDMIIRVEFFRDWIEKGLPIAYWVSAFYFPQGFLTSNLQGHSRRLQIPVDRLSFDYVVQDTDDVQSFEEPPPEGIYIFGLFLDGAGWNYEDGTIADQEYGVMFMKAPVINFVPYDSRVADTSKYACPLYKTSVRAGTLSTTGHSTNFVLFIELMTTEAPSYWILKGAAMLTMLND